MLTCAAAPLPSRRAVVTCIVAVVVFGQVDGSGGLHCDNVWPGPSKDNDLGACITDTKRLETNAANFVFPGICLVVGVLLLLVFPMVFFCCARSPPRCCKYCGDVALGERIASKATRRHLRVWILLLMVLSIAALVVMVVGSAELRKGVDDVFANMNEHVIAYFWGISDELQAIVQDSDTGNYTEPFATDTFDAINGFIADIRNTAEEYRTVLARYSNIVAKVGFGAAVLPIVAFSFTVAFAVCNVRRSLPSLSTWVYYAIGVVFSVAGCAVLVVATVFADVVVELELQELRQPGLFQWYVIPVCRSVVNFTDLKEQVAVSEAALAREFCVEVSKYCSATLTYDTSSPEDVFYCTTSASTASSDCRDFDTASLILAAMFAKSGSNACAGTNCSFAECPVLCSDGTLRSDANTAIALLQAAQRLFDGMELVLPLLACDLIVDRLLRMFDSFPAIRDGLVKMGVACFMTLVGVFLAWAVMLRGEHVWFSQEEYNEASGGGVVSDEMDGVTPVADGSEPVAPSSPACDDDGHIEPSLPVIPPTPSTASPTALAHV